MSIEQTHIRNPFQKWTYFSRSDNRVDLFTMCTAVHKDDTDSFFSYIRDLEPFEITTLLRRIKTNLDLEELDWGYVGGKCLVWCDVEDLPKLYDIVNAFLKYGYSIYIQDGTQVTFHKRDYPICPQKHEKLFLIKVKELESLGIETVYLIHLAIHRTDFWTGEEGKLFSATLRTKYFLPDRIDEENRMLSEDLGESD